MKISDMYIELESNGNRYKNSSLVGYLDETRTHLEVFIRDLKESTDTWKIYLSRLSLDIQKIMVGNRHVYRGW